jgi:hypothetical protein
MWTVGNAKSKRTTCSPFVARSNRAAELLLLTVAIALLLPHGYIRADEPNQVTKSQLLLEVSHTDRMNAIRYVTADASTSTSRELY